MSETARDTKHVTPWLGAYLDGELTSAARRDIKAHLAGCADCRADLEELASLSSLLQATPLPPAPTSERVFTRQVLQRITEPTLPFWQRVLQVGWRYAPLFVFATWAFIQAVSYVAGGLLLGLRFIPGVRSALPGLAGLMDSTDGMLMYLGRLDSGLQPAVESIGQFGAVSALPLISWLSGIVMALLILAWLASWWAYVQHRSTSVNKLDRLTVEA